MSTYEALQFLGLDYYATATDIKAAYLRLASALRPDPAVDHPELVRVTEERLQMLNGAYAALQHRVDHTPAEIASSGVEAGAKPAMKTAGLRVGERLKRSGEAWMQLRSPRVVSPRAWRAAAVFVVMMAVGYGIVRGAAEKHLAPTVVDAKTVSAPQGAPRVATSAARVAVSEKVSPAREKRASVLTAASRPLRAPALPSVDPVEAKAIGSACLAETGDQADAFDACVLRTARETPHAIHLD